jgi:hypothetical protein
MYQPITQAELEAIRERCEAATKGPWTTKPSGEKVGGFAVDVAVAATTGRQMIYANPPGGTFPAADQEFIAQARTYVPRLAEGYDHLLTAAKWALIMAIECYVQSMFDAMTGEQARVKFWAEYPQARHLAELLEMEATQP